MLDVPFTIYQSEQLRIAISPKETSICASQKVTFTASVLSNSQDVQYTWNQQPPNFRNVFTTPVYEDSKMVVKATDKNGCTARDEATITAPYCDSLFAKCVFFPNAFSPNNDGLNDTFGAHLGDCELKSFTMSVYNRWGQLIFQTRDKYERWTGAAHGSMPQSGTYIFTCVWEDAAGHAHRHKGAVVLIR
jgi:gliding motility-associated-like protein